MQISRQGLLALARLEGLALGPYRDSRGIWTSGIGHTAAAGTGADPARLPSRDTRGWSQAQIEAEVARALRQFEADLAPCMARVQGLITHPLEPHQFDALVSFEFNTGGLARAALRRQINAGDLSGAGFMGWVKPKELLARRKAERALFCAKDYAASGASVAIYDVFGAGQLRFRQSLSDAQITALLDHDPPFAAPVSARVWPLLRRIWHHIAEALR